MSLLRAFWRLLVALWRWILSLFGVRADPSVVRVVHHEVAQLGGTRAGLDVLGSTIGGTDYEILQISLGDVLVSFHGSTPPFRPAVANGVVTFGGHTFAAAPAVGTYLVDGRPWQPAGPGLYVFSDGALFGQVF